MKLSKVQEKEVMPVYQAWWKSYLTGDIKTYDYFLDNEYHFVGSTEAEAFLNRKDTTKFFEATADQLAGKSELRNSILNAEYFDGLIFITELADAYLLNKNEWTFYGKFRFSSVLKKNTDGWRFIYQHFSTPDSKAQEGETIGLEKISKENLQLRDAIKRRTIELENKSRELEIEASLERVRAQAMGMTKLDDLLSVCETLFSELQTLGFSELRNTMINIHNDEEKTFLNYDYSDKIGKSINHLEYNIHPVIKKQIKQIRSANDAFSETVFTGEDLKSWKEFRKKVGEKDDPRISSTSALYYYFYSIGTGSIGISTFSAITQEKLELLKRFRNVFNLSYQRYSDIALAETQARDAEIELGLERIRARAMAMQSSNELKEVVANLFDGMKSLGVDPSVCNIALVDKKTNDTDVWTAHQTDHGILTYKIFIQHFEHPFRAKLLDSFSKEIPFSVHELFGDLKKSYAQYLLKHVDYSNAPEEVTKSNEKLADMEGGIVLSAAYMKYGLLIISRSSAISNEESGILQRFAKVFEQTYTRFLDLKKAEAQAREAQIELGLERVRARAMAMQSSNELSELVNTLFKELTKLDFALSWCIINIIDEPSLTNMVWAANPNINEPPDSYRMKFEDYPFHHAMMKGYQERKTKFIYVLEGPEKKVYDEYLFKDTEFRKVPKEAQAASRAMEKYVCSFTFSNFGGLQTVGDEPLSDINLDILERFGKVFDLTYTRFNDLLKAEAQAREAQIEAALERVRSRSMAMHSSDEFVDASDVMVNQLKELGIDTLRIGIGIINNEDNSVQIWSRSEIKGKVKNTILGIVPAGTHPIFDNMVIAWKEKKPFFSSERVGDEVKEYYEKLDPCLSYPKRKEFNERETMTAFFFNHGSLNVISLEPLKEEDCNIMIRFAKVFGQIYQRFLDLQKAEAQAREAQIEAALERVRSRTMGMQKSEELKEVIRVVYEQFVNLKINVDHAGFVVDYTPRGDWHFWIADEQDIPSKITHPYFESVWANQFNEAKEKGTDFFATNLNFEEKNKFYNELLSYVPGLPEASKDFYLSCPGLAGSTVLLDNVGLYIENFSAIPYSDKENKILMRFGKVFQQTYTRFLDLQKAEAQARESQIEAALERVRSRAMAMHSSNELADVAKVMFNQIKLLGGDLFAFGIVLCDKNENIVEQWHGLGEGEMMTPFQVPIDLDYIHRFRYDKWKAEVELFSIEIPSDYIAQHFERMFELPSVKAVKEDLSAKGINLVPPPWEIDYGASFKNGYLLVSSLKPFKEAKIFPRFARVFEQAYTRFLDLQKAEAQAREAQIEGALERVRSKTMAMHNSNDVGDTVVTLFDEVLKLGLDKSIRCGIGILEGNEGMETWSATSHPNGKVDLKMGMLDMTIHPMLIGLKKAWESGETSYSYNYIGDDVFRYYEALNNEPEYPFQADLESLPENEYHKSFFYKEGILFSFAPNPISDEAAMVLDRFAGVFGQTYRRYLDLQKAEAQAREAQIEVALERVRAEQWRCIKVRNWQKLQQSSFSK